MTFQKQGTQAGLLMLMRPAYVNLWNKINIQPFKS